MSNLNKENKFENLERFCKEYFESVGIKVHASAVPVDAVLDYILGIDRVVMATMQVMTERLNRLESNIFETNKILMETLVKTNSKCDEVKKDELPHE